ncbi:MAG: bacillithiol biosynthesis BshC [Candidatus Eiseniibacteriota bacterium]|nr:MAG: bacillithiol biosynthesis BshC [Candidatus Eisenbacteria bacterium]
MLEQVTKAEPGLFKLPRLYVDYVSGNVAGGVESPEIFGIGGGPHRAPTGPGAGGHLWKEVLDYNSRLGAGQSTLQNARALLEGQAVPVLTGQQPGLFGGPLYTLYKVLTAAALSESLSSKGETTAVPVLWNASDDSDFEEVSTASFFDRDLSRKSVSLPSSLHFPGRMVGTVPAGAIESALETLREGFQYARNADFTLQQVGDALAVSRDMGEFFSALFLRVAASTGVVVVDARLSSVLENSKSVIGAYLKDSRSVEREVLETLKILRDAGYGEPVSARSAEVCVFLRDGETRQKVSRDDLRGVRGEWERGAVELLPNVLLGPVVRGQVTGAVAGVLGPSEISYSFVTSAVCRVLELGQAPVFPRLSMTVVPRDLTALLESDSATLADLVVAFDETARRYFRRSLPENVRKELDRLPDKVLAALEGVARLAAGAGRNVEQVLSSSRRKMEFETKRVRDAFEASYRKDALGKRPALRWGREMLAPRGTLQERSFCCLAPILHSDQSFISGVQDVARAHVEECLEGRVHHYIAVVDIP